MRYKSLPLSTRVPSTPDASAPSQSAPRPWLADWLATLPILLLIPALLLPYLVFGMARPRLAVEGTVEPGATIVIHGTDFAREKAFELRWDGQPRDWLPDALSNRSGRFDVVATIPKGMDAGTYQLQAVFMANGRHGKGRPLAALAVTVGSPEAAGGETPQPTPSSQPDPTPAETPKPTPKPTQTPDATPKPPAEEPAPSGPRVGYGAGVTGGSNVVVASSLRELRGAIRQGNHVVLRGSGTWDLAGDDLQIDVQNFTLDNSEAGIVFKGGSLRIVPPAGNVLLRDVKSRAGDQSGDAQVLDAITVNAGNGRIRGLYFDHVEAWWGPDVTFALLGDIADVTLDGVIIAGGLVKSRHPEANDDVYGHSMGLNMTALDGQAIGPQRITIYRSLIALNETRNPQLRKAGPVDIVDSMIFGHNKAPYGDALGGLNIIGTVYKRGAATAQAFGNAALDQRMPFRAVNKDGYLTRNSVYVDRTTRALDYSFGAVDAAVRADAPMVAPSVRSAGGDTQAIVLGYVGARRPAVDAITAWLLAAVRNDGGRYYNGVGQPPLNPSWP
ncbi:MAG TPA: hypothetical protein VFK61_05525 [Candidatus Limnocylindria bacterium]|jgi:hypothetical protein|nr:hypothetical protein [Candidatus Limnocylindria bacterium]